MYKSKVFQSETKIRNPKIKQPLVGNVKWCGTVGYVE